MENQLVQLAYKDTNYNGDYELSWAQYGEFKVLMFTNGPYKGYINATKLVSNAKNANGNPKRLTKWLENDNSALFKAAKDVVRIRVAELMHEVRGGNSDFTGTYCHYLLIPHIAAWASGEFAIKVSQIVTEYILKESNEKIEKLQIDNNEKSILIQKYSDEVAKNIELVEQQKYEISSNLVLLESSKNKLSKTKLKLSLNKSEFILSKKEIEVNKIELGVNKIELEDAKNKLSSTKSKLNINKTELRSSKREIESTKIEIEKLIKLKETLQKDLYTVKIDRVIPLIDNEKNNRFCIMKLNDPDYEFEYKTIRCQIKSVKSQEKKILESHQDAVRIIMIKWQPNSINLWNRIKNKYGPSTKENPDGKNRIIVNNCDVRFTNDDRNDNIDRDAFMIKIANKIDIEKMQ